MKAKINHSICKRKVKKLTQICNAILFKSFITVVFAKNCEGVLYRSQ